MYVAYRKLFYVLTSNSVLILKERLVTKACFWHIKVSSLLMTARDLTSSSVSEVKSISCIGSCSISASYLSACFHGMFQTILLLNFFINKWFLHYHYISIPFMIPPDVFYKETLPLLVKKLLYDIPLSLSTVAVGLRTAFWSCSVHYIVEWFLNQRSSFCYRIV